MTALTDHRAFLSDILTRQHDRRALIDPSHVFPPQPEITGYDPPPSAQAGPSKRQVVNYIEEEETVRNDLSGWYVQSGELGSNHIFGAADNEVCEEYPALRRLMDLKAQHVEQHSHPPLHLTLPSASAGDITSLLGNTRFDVLLLRPLDSWQETADLPIRNISADPGFVFLWVGKGDDEGLERGRECFAKWGFRRAEDIVWVKTNKSRSHKTCDEEVPGQGAGGEGLFASSKEHCLMGIRGTVRRSTDSRFVHCNVDTDVIVYEGSDDDGSATTFPPYLYTLIENFCLGARRLELFADPSQSRRGWVTASLHSPLSGVNASDDISAVPGTFDPMTYATLLPRDDARPVLPFHAEIDQLRPKSPVRRGGPPRSTSGLPNNPNLPPRPPRHQHQHQPHPQMPMMDPMAMQMQIQMQLRMQMQQAQMMAAMNMMDPMMLAQAQAMQMQQAMAGQGQQQTYAGPGHAPQQIGYGPNVPYNPYEEQYGQGQYHGGQTGQFGQPGQFGGGQYPPQGGPGWGWQQ